MCANAMGKLIWRNMHTFKPHFAVVKPRIGINDLHVTLTQTLDLAALQHDASFDNIQNGVVVTRLAVAGDEFGVGG